MHAQPSPGPEAESSQKFGHSTSHVSPREQNAENFPKTLIIDLSKGYGGVTSRVLALMRSSPSDRIALAGLEGGVVVQHARQLGLCVYVLGKRKTDWRILPRLARLIREQRFEVVDTQNVQSKFWASLTAMISSFAFVSTVHSWYESEHEKSIKGKIYTALELLTNWGLDLYIAVSRRDRRSLQKVGLTDDRIHLIYNAVSIEPGEIPGDSAWLKKRFDLPSDSIVCTAVGRLVPVKGYDVLIEAVRRIASDIPRLTLLIVGEGETKAELERQIEQSNLQGRVQLVGYQERDSVMSILKASDIFVMPSHYEGTPIALLEAAALARPILASDTGGIPELVDNCEQALLVAPGDPQALSEGLGRLANDPQLARALGLSAQVRVNELFNLDLQIKETWNAYRKAWSNRYAKY